MAESRDIFIVCNNLDELGGLNTWAHYVGRLFAERGHRVHLVGVSRAPIERSHDYGTAFPYTTTVLTDTHPAWPWRPNGLRDRCDLPARLRERRRKEQFAASTARLSELFAAAAPGGIVIVAQVWAMEWVAAADTTGLRVIGMSHESYAATRTSSRFGRVKRYYADVDRFLTLTQQDADTWARAGMGNAGSMGNPLHMSAETQADLAAPVVVRLGRLSYEKGQDMLLQAWAEIAPGSPGWSLRLYGAGPEEDALRAQTAALGIGGSVVFAGSTADISGALLGGSVFALTSREEGFPMSIMEAMAHGVPCVAFDCAPGIRELITDGVDGFVVAPGNVPEFARAVRMLIDDPELRRKFGQCARESVQRFAPGPIVDQWERIFDLLHR